MLRGLRHLPAQVGRRGVSLLFFAVLDIFYSLSLAAPPAEAARSSTLLFIAGVAPLWAWASLWGLVGGMCLAGAFLRSDQWAFSAVAGLKTLWGLTFLLGWIFTGLDRGWVSAVIWLAMAGWLLVISTWPEPPHRFIDADVAYERLHD